MVGRLLSVLLILGLSSCATGGRKEREILQEYFKTGQYQKGLEYLESSSFYRDEDVALLAAMERGLLLHRKGDLEASIVVLEKAKEIADKLYTESLSKKVLASMANDTYDKFYGEVFERSMIYFYLALNHLHLYHRNHKSKNLFSARAQVLAWDSYLKSIQDERLGRTVFKNDLLAKLLGGLIHETVGTAADRNTALQLYKDAKEVLLKNYNAYPAFNKRSEEFRQDFDKLPSMPITQVKKKYVAPTPLQEELVDFLDEKIKGHNNHNNHNVAILFQRGIIPPKVPELYYFGLGHALRSKDSQARKAARFGVALVSAYAIRELDLLPPPGPRYKMLGRGFWGMQSAHLLATEAAIAFELPKIDNRPLREKAILEVFKGDGEKVVSRPLPLAQPLGDIAEEAVAEGATWRYGRVGLRLGLKHLVAIAASYGTYRHLSKGGKENKFWAKTAATTQYALASRAIRESEKADTRSWSSLPRDLRFTSLYLPPGKYRLQVKVEGEDTRVFSLGTLSIDAQKKQYFISHWPTSK